MRWISFFVFILAFVFLGLFVADLRGFFNVAHIPVAYLQQAHGTVRRLAKNDLTWDRAEMGTLFGAEDTISTGEEAGARLTFYAGGEIDLGPGTMVYLGGSVEELQLSFVSGKAKIRMTQAAKQKIKIASAPFIRKRRMVMVAEGKPSSSIAGGTEVSLNDQTNISSPFLIRNLAQVELETVNKLNVAPMPDQGQLKLGKGAINLAKLGDLDLSGIENTMITKAIEEKSIRNMDKVLSTDGKIASTSYLPERPEILFPDEDAVIKISSRDHKMKWKLSKNEEKSKLKHFEILLRLANSEAKPKIIKTRKFFLPISRLGKGKYLWSVRSVSKDGKKGPRAKARWLEVKIPAKIAPPRVLPVNVE